MQTKMKIKTGIDLLMAVLPAMYGLYLFGRKDILSYMFLKRQFVEVFVIQKNVSSIFFRKRRDGKSSVEMNDPTSRPAIAGKKVVPFCSHGTGGLASSVKDIQETIHNWLEEIGY